MGVRIWIPHGGRSVSEPSTELDAVWDEGFAEGYAEGYADAQKLRDRMQGLADAWERLDGYSVRRAADLRTALEDVA